MIVALSEPQALPEARRTCAKCGSTFSAFGREYRCAACRRPKERTRQAPSDELSARERQIVRLICEAKSNKVIGFELCLTEGTIKEYLHRIFGKAHVTNRTELALWYLRQQPKAA
jgi:DNA-binding NarL/FixJ family response regulator